MKKSKLFVALLMAVLMLGSTFAAMPANAADDSAPVVYSYDTTVTTTPEAWTAWQNWAKAYYPDIVNFQPPKSAGGWGSWVNKVVLSPTTKERWDAVPSPVSRFAAEWAIAGAVRPVMDIINKANANNIKKWMASRPDLVKAWSYDGKCYGIPYGGKPAPDGQAWAWRADVLKKVGFTSPPKTVADLEKFAAAVKKNFPAMIPFGMGYNTMTEAIQHPLTGSRGWYTHLKNGMVVGLRFSEQFMFPMLAELNKMYKAGWLSVDTDVAAQKDGNYIRNQFQAGKFAVVPAGYGVNSWGETYYQIKKTHPSWGPIIAKNVFSGPKGSGRNSQHGWDNQLAVMLSASNIGNEAAQIRLVKYLDWQLDPKNLWFYIPQRIGPQGWAATYKIDTKANKVQILSQVAKPGFGTNAGSIAMWQADDWTRVEKIASNATQQTKLSEAARKIIQSHPKSLWDLNYVPEVTVPGLVEKYPAANGVMWGGTYDKMAQDVSKSESQLLQAYRDWVGNVEKAGGFIMMDETYKMMIKVMGPDDAAAAKKDENFEK